MATVCQKLDLIVQNHPAVQFLDKGRAFHRGRPISPLSRISGISGLAPGPGLFPSGLALQLQYRLYLREAGRHPEATG